MARFSKYPDVCLDTFRDLCVHVRSLCESDNFGFYEWCTEIINILFDQMNSQDFISLMSYCQRCSDETLYGLQGLEPQDDFDFPD